MAHDKQQSQHDSQRPAAKSPDSAQAKPESLNGHRVSGPILIVDDNVDVAKSLEMLLVGFGFEAHSVYSGAAALKWVESHLPAVILLDIGMPGMDGYEVARRLRAMPNASNVLLVAVSGWGQADDRRDSSAAGCDLHLVKPVRWDELRPILDDPRQHAKLT